ncbi:MAG TPA: HDOD domain-containing protein [Gammaproteobacteria bacterium]|nr:HDOD domain-containing protein [Gammaproteobacteria bacterium]
MGDSADRAETDHEAEPQGLDGWIRYLSDQGMPVLARTVRDVSGVASNRASSAAELARVVLQDAGMTARLLRIANSPHFNPGRRSVSTVSRAVVLLGFDTVRSICLSIAVVESLVDGPHRDELVREMARSFHAAVQARSFALKRNDSSPEEVFIATLLFRLGKMAFLIHGGKLADRLARTLARTEGDAGETEQRVLGFRLRQLTAGLTQEWKLGALVRHALEGKQDADPRVSNVVLGHELSRCAEQGWNTPETRHLMERIAETLYLPLDQVSRLVGTNAVEAARTVTYYGAQDAGRLIPVPSRSGTNRPGIEEDSTPEPAIQDFPEPDPLLQLQILREVSALMETRPDISLLLEMVLEGIYRGVGMDRTLFALRSADKQMLKARYSLGWQKDRMQRQFLFEINPLKANVFSHLLETSEALWVSEQPDADLAGLLTPAVTELTEGAPFFAMSIEVQGQPIGLFYADRQPSGRALDEESFSSFKHFCQQANMVLSQTRRPK